MCGIAGFFLNRRCDEVAANEILSVMSERIRHRGPDGRGEWLDAGNRIGLAHRRLSIIDPEGGQQPMKTDQGDWIVFNGAIYNYIELREKLGIERFKTNSDTEVILEAYREYGKNCVDEFRGMFAFAIWDAEKGELFCARDRFGIKPFYYAQTESGFFFGSECKAILPVCGKATEINVDAFRDYLTFQFPLRNRSLFQGIEELPPAHTMVVKEGACRTPKRYWEVHYDLDFNHSRRYFEEKLTELINDSVELHTRSDVPIGAYVSGGIDSSSVAVMAAGMREEMVGFNGRFDGALYDELQYAEAAARMGDFPLHHVTISSQDFVDSIENVIWHLDYPVAGPGSFPQYHVSKLASQYRKVVLGGQGGDEVFGGYARYLVAYFEQCIKGAIDGTLDNGEFIVTYESIIPNLRSLKNYKPMLRQQWSDGLFDDADKRYFQLINRAPTLDEEIEWGDLGDYDPYESFRDLFFSKNVVSESYFDQMTHFDCKTLLPALLQVEDRMSMAHGLESRVPLLDHPLIEFAATMPSNIKFKDGTLKMALTNAMKPWLPPEIVKRKDKMGFPVPLNDWLRDDPAVREFVNDHFRSQSARERPFFNRKKIIEALDQETKFGRKIWGLLSLELWHQQFLDG